MLRVHMTFSGFVKFPFQNLAPSNFIALDKAIFAKVESCHFCVTCVQVNVSDTVVYPKI